MHYFIFDKKGHAVAYIQKQVIFSIKGKALSFIRGENVFSYRGKQIGTFDKGWVRDLKGNCVFYGKEHSGVGPITPIPQIPPIPYIAEIPPVPSIPEIPHIRAIPTFSWSPFTTEEFFNK